MKARTLSPNSTASLTHGGLITHEWSEQPEEANKELLSLKARGVIEVSDGKAAPKPAETPEEKKKN
jgi:hypothetical protein